MLLKLMLTINAWAGRRLAKTQTFTNQQGQATAEYALVLLGAAAVAMLLVSWVTGTNRISNLLDAVFRHITGLIS